MVKPPGYRDAGLDPGGPILMTEWRREDYKSERQEV